MLIDKDTGIIYREDTFDNFIVKESRGYFPLGITESDRILDLGGHIGSFAARALLERPGTPIVSIEAEQSNFAALQENATKFGFTAKHNAIVADELDGQEIQLYVNVKKNNAAHSILETRGRATQTTVGVGFTRTLQEVQPTIIKCDIEAAEFLLPWNKLAEAPQVQTVIMELHLLKKGHREKAREYLDMFRGLGFQCTREPKIGEKNWTTLAVWKR